MTPLLQEPYTPLIVLHFQERVAIGERFTLKEMAPRLGLALLTLRNHAHYILKGHGLIKPVGQKAHNEIIWERVK